MVTAPKAEDIIAAYIKVRDQKEAVEARHKEELAPYKEKLSVLGTALLEIMQTVGTTEVKGPAGTAFRTLKTSATVEDRDTFKTFILEHDEWGLADLRASKVAVEQYKEEHGEIPPGIKYSSMYDVNVRRK